ncbi:aspartyl-tRNA(Asn)/glutamyl-tRNA(Gln) amidotransferase subunit B [Candidatus Gastranaerophilus sp. (ex Termes propinquus)]|nr:aspartyl-tRNA(Asn)/glutamyl-tRNA(Gln) amidotransferase subunit B [Candidatus Gastranaerophilus sp. (ex Termes propinquus)]
MEDLKEKYELVIGLEVHAQMKTKSKIFAPDGTEFGKEPNTQTSAITLALPGALPVLNRAAVEMAILCGLAINSKIPKRCKFDRKQYFYADLPSGYQISQFDEPICLGGSIKISNKTVGITRAHLEQDAGKLVHAGADGLAGSSYSLVDLNRAGVTLLEIVSEPDMRSAEEAREYMEQLRMILRYINVCDGNLEEGSMRCDANVSVRVRGAEKFGTRVEIKNLNSFKALVRAIEFEYDRHIDCLETGVALVQETRLWDDNKGVTQSMRGKEEAHDYRYFPEPDLMPLEISDEWIDKIRATMPELPSQKFERYKSLGLSEYDADLIINQMDIALFFDEALKAGVNPKIAANFLMGEISAYIKDEKTALQDTKLTVENFAKLLKLIESGTISNNIAKSLIIDILKEGADASALVEQKGLSVISDQSQILDVIKEIIKANPEQVAAYKAGKDKLFGFFVGQAMKETKGRANPQTLNELLKSELAK